MKQWFALKADGELMYLGQHLDFGPAEIYCQSIWLDVIWILDETAAKQFQRVLNDNLTV